MSVKVEDDKAAELQAFELQYQNQPVPVHPAKEPPKPPRRKAWTASRMGKKGGAARAKVLSPERRREIAAQGYAARMAKQAESGVSSISPGIDDPDPVNSTGKAEGDLTPLKAS